MIFFSWFEGWLQRFFLDAPRFIQVFAVIIVVLTGQQWFRLRSRVNRARDLCQGLIPALKELRQAYQPGLKGLSGEGYQALRKVFEERPTFRHAWTNYEAELVRAMSRDDSDLWFSERSAEASFSDAAVFGSRINWKWFAAYPSFVTGLGLLVTFGAILFALSDLKADSSNQIHGIPTLLEGLSGKFLSSVVALICASFFVPFERDWVHKLEQGRQSLIAEIDQCVPRLTPARILVDVRRDSAEQLDALRELLTGLGPRLRQGLDESIRPTLDRMVAAIDELNQSTRAADAQRQDALTSALKQVLDQLNERLQKTLESIGEGFSQSLVGQAGESFDRVLASLEGTGRLVDRLNTQFEENQGAMRSLVELARDSAGRQIELGKTQVEELSSVLRQLMERLNEAAGSSVAQMNTALADAIRRMAAAGQTSNDHVAKLVSELTASVEHSNGAVLAKTKETLDQVTGEMAQAFGRNAQATHESVKRVIDETNELSRQNSERIAAVLERYQLQLDRTESLGGQLNHLAEELRAALPQYAAVTKSLQSVANESNTAAQRSKEAALAVQETANTLRNVHGQVTEVAKYSAEQVTQLASAARQTRESMNEYERVFARVKIEAGELLNGAAERLKQQTDTAREGYEAMNRVANEFFSNAASRLGGSIGELAATLEELQVAIESLRNSRNGSSPA
jgi:DNA repair exonuclease SbcCD ATPase subunit